MNWIRTTKLIHIKRIIMLRNNNWDLNTFQLYDQFYAAYNQLDAVIHKHNTENQQEQLKELKDSGKKNAAAAQEVHLRLTALLDSFEEGKQIDVNAANQELQGIMDVSSSITSPDYNSAKKSFKYNYW